jgi:hypothetical protein
VGGLGGSESAKKFLHPTHMDNSPKAAAIDLRDTLKSRLIILVGSHISAVLGGSSIPQISPPVVGWLAILVVYFSIGPPPLFHEPYEAMKLDALAINADYEIPFFVGRPCGRAHFPTIIWACPSNTGDHPCRSIIGFPPNFYPL